MRTVAAYEQRVIEIPVSATEERIILDKGAVVRVIIGSNPSFSLEAELVGEGASLSVVGVFQGADNDAQYIRVRAIARAPRTSCTMRFRAALSGAASSVFDGLVRMEEGAHGARGFLSYRALLLSPHARAKPTPRLEVLTRLVASAGHEGSVGKIPEDQLFYLQSRGLSRSDAEHLIVSGFLNLANLSLLNTTHE